MTEIKIKSPIIGTFYNAEPPIKIGDRVVPKTVVGEVKAMEVPIQIRAGVGGTIIKVCAEDEQDVKYQQTLFVVKLDWKNWEWDDDLEELTEYTIAHSCMPSPYPSSYWPSDEPLGFFYLTRVYRKSKFYHKKLNSFTKI